MEKLIKPKSSLLQAQVVGIVGLVWCGILTSSETCGILGVGRFIVSDFAFQYFNTELEKLALPELNQILEKVSSLICAKTGGESPIFFRELGGLEDEFYMASDFDETPACFEEYM